MKKLLAKHKGKVSKYGFFTMELLNKTHIQNEKQKQNQ
jgi:hypothetical protein